MGWLTLPAQLYTPCMILPSLAPWPGRAADGVKQPLPGGDLDVPRAEDPVEAPVPTNIGSVKVTLETFDMSICRLSLPAWLTMLYMLSTLEAFPAPLSWLRRPA